MRGFKSANPCAQDDPTTSVIFSHVNKTLTVFRIRQRNGGVSGPAEPNCGDIQERYDLHTDCKVAQHNFT